MKEFKTLGGFAAHLARLATVGNEVTEHIAEKAAESIRDDAKGKLGTYQGSVGPFPGWKQLAQETKDERVTLGFTPNDPLLRSGQLRDAIESSVQTGGATVGVPHGPHIGPRGEIEDVGDIALRMELGSGAPPRPFLGPAAFQSKPKVSKIAGVALAAWLVGANWLKPPSTIRLP